MFRSAYLKLTVWYVAVIMVLSLAFSLWVYNEAAKELQAGFDKVRGAPLFIGKDDSGRITVLVQDQIEASRQRILLNLIYLNLFVLIFGAVGSYLLAKRTMRPIAKAMEAQNRFTADASHELRTPLTAMKTDIEVTLRDKNRSPQEVERLLASNLEEIDRMTALSEGLLSLAQPLSEDAEFSAVSLDECAKQACQRFKTVADKKQITLTCQARPAVARASRRSIEKVLGILLDNAIKYSGSQTTVWVETRVVGKNAVEFEVRDQGQGIGRGDIDHIFDRFYRADNSRSKTLGYGLGLAIAKKMVTAAGGSIRVVSQRGKGSSFIVRFASALKVKNFTKL